MRAEQKHPADELAKTLARANGILTLLSGCYERESGTFATSMSYVHESIVALEAILAKATEAMSRLYQQCDLSLVREMPEAAPAVQEIAAGSQDEAVHGVAVIDALPAFSPALTRQIPTVPAVHGANSYLGLFGPQEVGGRMKDRIDDLLHSPAASLSTSAETTVRPAQTYDELLAKITAVADKAAYRAHRGQADASLVPELEALREDLVKLRHVA